MVNEGRHIPNRLRKYQMMGLSQQDVATFLGHKSTCRISRWEQGISMPSVLNLFKLAILYGTLSEELYYDVYSNYKQTLSERKKNLTKTTE